MAERPRPESNSLLNGAEKKILNWLAERQPKWVNSDILTLIGLFGSVVIAAGYILTDCNIGWIWLASLGLVINWYGDSLDGTLARFRKAERPIYGYYVDHTVDCINEFLMFAGIGISRLMRFDLAMILLIFYFLLTLNVAINAHLKSEFKLTYWKLGPTEFRLLVVIANTALFLQAAAGYSPVSPFGREIENCAGHRESLYCSCCAVVHHQRSRMPGYARIDFERRRSNVLLQFPKSCSCSRFSKENSGRVANMLRLSVADKCRIWKTGTLCFRGRILPAPVWTTWCIDAGRESGTACIPSRRSLQSATIPTEV